MAAVTICSDFGAQENSLSLFSLFPHLFAGKWCDQIPWSSFFECWDLSQLFLSSFTFNKMLHNSSLLSAITVMLSAYLRLLIFLLAILIPACASSSLAFCKMFSAYKLNNIQPWRTPFQIWNQSIILRLVLTVASSLAYRFRKKQIRWSGIPTFLRISQFVVIYTKSA